MRWESGIAVSVTLPKPPVLLTSLPGAAQITVLNRLNASARNSSFRPSPAIGKARNMEKSRFQYRCALNGSGRRLPKVPNGAWNALVLIQQVWVWTWAPSGQLPELGSPTRLACSYPAQPTFPVLAGSPLLSVTP